MIKNIGAIFNLTLFIFILIGCHQDQMEIFISPDGNDANGGTREKPLKTMNKALEKSRQVQGRISKTIHLLEGNYYLNAPVTITPEDNNLSIIGEGSDKVVIKGSRLLALVWTPFRDNVWVAEVPVQMDFDQLYINGEKQVLARYPNFDGNTKIFNGYAADAIAKERVQNWKDPRGGFVHALHSGRWGGFHYEIIGVDESGELTLKGGHQNNRPSDMHPEFRMVENIFEELDDQNEWYYDKRSHKLYLWPSSGVDLNKAIVEISDLNHLVDLRGTREKPVHNVSIEGIRFEHSRRTFMEKYHPLLRSDWTIYRGGALFLDGTEFCSIIDCEFVHLGGNVIFVNGYNRDSEIRGNYIHDCGASAISFVGDSTAVRSGSYQYQEFVPFEEMDTMVGPANDLYPSDCKVVNNLIHDIGQIEKQVAGVEISMAMQIEVAQNSIYNVPRAGINISEGTWGGHIIEYNDVFNTVLETGDHGSFNSWGRDRFWHPVWDVIDSLVVANPQMPYWDAMYPTIIRNNRFRCDHGWDIDLDDGSSNYHIYNNLCLNGGIKLREGFYRTVENNIMVNNGFHPHVWFENSGDVVKRNILMTKHFPIRLKGWGEEIDFNLFPDSISLALAQENGTDLHSRYGDPAFQDPAKGNFNVGINSIAIALGFQNFPMDKFGVQKEALKAMAGVPDIPHLNNFFISDHNATTKDWLGGVLRNIETPEEQSAYGLHKMEGVLVTLIAKGSALEKAGIVSGDVIIGAENSEIKTIGDLMIACQENLWRGNIHLVIFRDQMEIEFAIDI